VVAAGEGTGSGLGDSGLFAQALNNVIENALRYSPADRPVEVTARVADGVVAVEVRDSGPGVPDADMARIFERFFRSETTQYLPGTGLGLAIAAAIMKAMDGTIEAQNLAEAGGLSVTLTLPAAP
jgi:signal transduction histidine kinase